MKRLFRSEKDRKIAGVVGGLAEYFNIDAAAANHHSLIVYFFDGIPVLLIYIVWVFVVPNEGDVK
ncbi:membrane protein [Bacillus glycinifermentans]|nr:membrane protein [Bacillus glycinifermentans]